jgi:alkanesulfonate monooxygenase SsuD/methylene tetrahydromethanopterin reductase-like flavin-dependent oxidoreductase (luciferase family)
MLTRNVRAERLAMYGKNRLKLGFFGANCSSGKSVTTAPERWSGAWGDMLDLAREADACGIDFLLPIGRWKGYGGTTDFQGATYETLTWATGLLAATKRITVFGTVHAPLYEPMLAAKQIATADHVGHGRFGLNIVCGWNEGEFEMFGVEARDHDGVYAHGQQWIDAVRAIWAHDDEKPYGGTEPLIMNAGQSPEGRAFALRNCDALFTSTRFMSNLDRLRAEVSELKAAARRSGREIEVFAVSFVCCRPSKAEAEEYVRYVMDDCCDWGAIDGFLDLKGLRSKPADELAHIRAGYPRGLLGYTSIGTPDEVAQQLAGAAEAGLDGIGLWMVNYGAELPYLRDEVLPRLARAGLRGGP